MAKDINSTNGYLNMDLLRFTTAGSVDDGKSTLIGRLLYDSKSIFDDQVEDLERISQRTGEQFNLALLTDGLRAEREQGITIDVAYRYFATPQRKFIIADTPGHLQYTRNMVTGASTADLAIILIDARQGVVEQTRRHTFIAKLLGIEHIVVCVNKMDLVNFDEKVYKQIVHDFADVKKELNADNVVFIPISALNGDNVVNASEHTPWYKGTSLLHHLERVIVHEDNEREAFSLPVQGKVGQNGETRFIGRIASGALTVGKKVRVLPYNTENEIEAIELFGNKKTRAIKDESVTVRLKTDTSVLRGDLIVDDASEIQYTTSVLLDVCWFNERSLDLSKGYIFASVAGEFSAKIKTVNDKIDFTNLKRLVGEKTIGVNDIATLRIIVSQAVPVIAYAKNKTLGSAILIDPVSNETVAAGMIK